MKPLLVVVVIAALCYAGFALDKVENTKQAKRDAEAEVLIDGRGATVHTLFDRQAKRTYRFVVYDRGAIILPDAPAPTVEPTK